MPYGQKLGEGGVHNFALEENNHSEVQSAPAELILNNYFRAKVGKELQLRAATSFDSRERRASPKGCKIQQACQKAAAVHRLRLG